MRIFLMVVFGFIFLGQLGAQNYSKQKKVSLNPFSQHYSYSADIQMYLKYLETETPQSQVLAAETTYLPLVGDMEITRSEGYLSKIALCDLHAMLSRFAVDFDYSQMILMQIESTMACNQSGKDWLAMAGASCSIGCPRTAERYLKKALKLSLGLEDSLNIILLAGRLGNDELYTKYLSELQIAGMETFLLFPHLLHRRTPQILKQADFDRLLGEFLETAGDRFSSEELLVLRNSVRFRMSDAQVLGFFEAGTRAIQKETMAQFRKKEEPTASHG